MASMQQIIVKITGQDNLTPVLAKIAKSMDKVDKSGKKVSTSFTSSLNQMEKNASKTATQINKSLQKANQIQFKALAGGFKTSVKEMETKAQGASKTINKTLKTINKTKFQTLGTEFQKATETIGSASKTTSKGVERDFDQVNKTRFKPLSTEFQKATETMETLSKISGNDIGNALAHVNNTQFIGLSANFQKATETMETLSKIGAADIGNALAHVNNTQFIGLSAKFQTAIKGMETASKAAGTGIARDFDQVNRTRFTGIVSSFTSAMSSMGSAAKSAVKGIGASFEGLSGVMAGVAGGMGFKEMFDQAMSRQTTMAVLSNRFGEDKAKEFQNVYYDHTKRSSTKDENLDVLAKGMFRLKNIDPESSKRLLRISDALVAAEGTSYDKLELSKSLQALFMGNPKKLKDDMPVLYDKLGAAVEKGDTNLMMDILEKEALDRGAIQKMGAEGLGTTTEGPLGDFNVVLSTAESILIEAIQTMTYLVHNCLAPFANWLGDINKASSGLVFKLIGWGAVLSTLAMGAGLLISVFGKLGGPVLKPIISALSKFGGAILKIVSKIPGIGTVIDKLRNIRIKPKIDSTSKMNVKAGTVIVKGLQGGVDGGGSNVPGDGTTKTTKGKSGKGGKGKVGRVGRIISRVPGVGRFSGIGSSLGGGLKGLGGLSRLGGLAAGAARFAGPIGLALTGATAAYGAYQGWNETKGPWQEKSKGAIGGAVEQLSFGLINKQQTMDGINWLYNQTQAIPGKIGGFLGQVKDRVTKPFVDAWNNAKQAVNKGIANVTNYIKGVPGKIKQGLANVWATITTPFTNALNSAKTIVSGGIDTVVSAFTALPGKIGGAMKSAYDTVMGWSGQITDSLKKVYCIIMGCSPGIIPAFKKLGKDIPRQVDKTLPSLASLSSAMNIPSTSLEVSAIPSLDGSALDSLTVPLTSAGSGGYGSQYSSVSTVSTIYNDHNHYHEPITINAKDMSLSEFKSTLISVLEEGKHRYTPP